MNADGRRWNKNKDKNLRLSADKIPFFQRLSVIPILSLTNLTRHNRITI